MTNKNLNRSNTTQLPEVGDRYKNKITGDKFTCSEVDFYRNEYVIFLKKR